jgi:hypothetical protein
LRVLVLNALRPNPVAISRRAETVAFCNAAWSGMLELDAEAVDATN